MEENLYEGSCQLCPRKCGANRMKEKGMCGVDARLQVARAALHFWEEPCISGERGSGTVFFSGCSLGCIYCQNGRISRGEVGKFISRQRLVEIFFELEQKGAHNINLLTAGQFAPSVSRAIETAKSKNIGIPFVYNTSSYETVDALKMFDGLIDIYLPDYKYSDCRLAEKLSFAIDYPQVAEQALLEMQRQVGRPCFDENGMMAKGMIVRHLVLPGLIQESKKALKRIYQLLDNRVYYSIMSQYTPMNSHFQIESLNRKLTEEEYNEVVDYACNLGIEFGFIQEGDTADESFIPPFDGEGVW